MSRGAPCWNLSTSSAFDLVLAALFPLAILLVCFRLARDFEWSQLRELCLGLGATSKHGPFSLVRVHKSYAQYVKLSANELYVKRTSYSSLGRAHKRLGNKIGYLAKLDRLKYVTDLNSTITDGIVELAEAEYNLGNAGVKGTLALGHGELARVREALGHYVRDWSAEGAEERDKIFTPIIEVLKRASPTERENMSVLVPGCGLGRLAWEISELGFSTTANELSYFMILAFRFLVSSEKTVAINEHTLRPYAHWFSHQRSNENLFRSVNFPDVLPRLSSKFKLVEGDFLKIPLPAPESAKSAIPDFAWEKRRSTDNPHKAGGYDYIVTLFFIDTSSNVFSTMEHIYHLLKPGGVWINLGPLLWTSGGQTKLELSLEEVLAAAHEIGFIEDPSIERRSIECEYTSDSLAMMRWTYKAEFWTMRKPT